MVLFFNYYRKKYIELYILLKNGQISNSAKKELERLEEIQTFEQTIIFQELALARLDLMSKSEV